MMIQQYNSAGVTALGSALLMLLLLREGMAIYPRQSVWENDCIPAYINDGDCDYPNNIEICGELKIIQDIDLSSACGSMFTWRG